jgi:hypothetical protein
MYVFVFSPRIECCADGEKYACEWNQADVVTLLLEHGAAVDARNAGSFVTTSCPNIVLTSPRTIRGRDTTACGDWRQRGVGAAGAGQIRR